MDTFGSHEVRIQFKIKLKTELLRLTCDMKLLNYSLLDKTAASAVLSDVSPALDI